MPHPSLLACSQHSHYQLRTRCAVPMPDIIIFVDHQDRSRILSSSGKLVRKYYTDRMELAVDLPGRAVAIVCIDRQAVAVGSFRRSMKITSYDRRYEVSDINLLAQPVPLTTLYDSLPAQVKTYFSGAISQRMALPGATSRELARVISSMSPNASELIARASGSPARIDQVSISRLRLLAEEKDAVGLVSELSGLGRDQGSIGRALMIPMEQVDPSGDYLESVHEAHVSRFAQYKPRGRADNDEDSLIAADMERFDGILGERASRNSRGIVIRHPTNGPITVLNTNKVSLESTYGSDLIYYNVNRRSGVLIQYKRMALDKKSNEWIYRGDSQLKKQLTSMRELPPDPAPSGVAEYRLSPDLHYLKMIRPTDYDGRSTQLMEGMYVPLSLVDLMLTSEGDTTEGGNLRIFWKDGQYPTQRHLNNTHFTHLFRDGWIGSCGTTTDAIRSLVEEFFEADDLVTVAIDEQTRPRPSSSSHRR
jgi:hypothetical protein